MGGLNRVVERKPPPSLLASPFHLFRNLRQNSNLVRNMISRDFKINYHGHILGYFWSLLEPLALTGIFYLVFIILRGQADTLLPLNIMLGILIFQSFSRTLSNCTNCLVQNSALIKQIYFPREIFPSAIAGFRFASLSLSMFIIVPYMIYENMVPTDKLVLLPLAMIFSVLLGQGLGMATAVIQVRIRDLRQVIDLVLRAAFFLSGVFFTADIIPEEHLELYFMNPLAVFIEMSRVAVTGDMGVLST
ncbi:MAG: ABC transporter permease, partial [Candidatus Thermoplasmatota archaeon]|nr:ABC transporter permease [Candidatus Thermoplasmatota archaeon]